MSPPGVSSCVRLRRNALITGKKIKSARFLMNSEPNDPYLPTLAQMGKAYGISMSALEERVSGFGTCPVVNCIYHVPNERKSVHKRVRSVNHKNDKSKSLKHNVNSSVNDCDIGEVIVNTNDGMSVIDSSNVSISDGNKVSLNDNDMDHNSEYVQPPKRLTAKISVKHNLNDSVVSENKFDKLSVDDNEAEQGVIIQIKRPSPIMLKRTEHFIQDLKKINDEWGPVESKLGGLYIKLFTQSDEASHGLTKFLRTNDMGYFIIVPRSERPIKVVIRGLPRDLNVDVLKKALVEEYEFVVDKVVQLTRFKTKEPLELFQVTLPNIDVNKGIWKITSLLYLKIKVVKFERKTGSIQCFNCNYWHHSTATCSFKPRCIKCGGQHAKDECTTPSETIICINCKQEGHVASYRGCPMFPKSNKNPSLNERKQITSRKSDPSIPYASHFNKKRLQVNIPRESQIDMDRVKEATTANYIPEVEANELKDILYVLNETKRLFSGSDIKWLASQLRGKNDDVDKIHLLIKHLPTFSPPKTA
ncbi:hypothetical protein AVEN_34037-1 [Araneus ventricosus]|uniref:Nucleic-acid-binding protein from transposon X-element n=1 Tax=Araneus ventricosus TaxID=182803 RepID=A0A4Y2J812_ARAVE|nr:hypothetical protein AVEN_34037-1 [Araneus ventricosus]